ncbi:HGL189Cp [Eremothecium sinecaudum]|uniref:HGL189Cp n=1 Tax=Eremothecium sinecaudum TaxID=45286 RepID=A0A0X8HUT8_9SACH|nr:HGL189Cp [Eremothecium sinecaudum]AMD22151.1 HGL189Cp [Eremothecium sinecaudum]
MIGSGMNLKLVIVVIGQLVWLAACGIATDIMRDGAGSSIIDFGRRRGGDDDKCPPCFNCMLPIFECKQYSTCNSYSGRCECRPGFGGDDCSKAVCGALSDDRERRPLKPDNGTCMCEPGWSGINCNICEQDSVCDSFVPEGLQGTCYKNGMIVKSMHQGCNVTNKQILALLNGAIPQVTFSCNKTAEECNFQFWVDQKESFYCGLNNCAFEIDVAQNTSHYKCENVSCKCLAGEMLCGKSGSIDISDFLTQAIKGPGDFSCNLKNRKCEFSEPSMNELIESIFGDPNIKLECNSGECLHYSEIPGYELPDKENLSLLQVLMISLTSLVVLVISGLSAYFISKSPLFGYGYIQLQQDEDDSMDDFFKSNCKAALTFENISYEVSTLKNNSVGVLKKISGIVEPGQILAIIGSSGAGKTCLLDILSMKNKIGRVSGVIKVNGEEMNKAQYTKLVGFIDQEDYFLPTLTVYETVLNSALLRLPKSMSFAAKQKRVYEVLEELRIFDIKDRLIGNELQRGISGGEKRRVSIACELVTSPLILFLDEPTSGLDSNNANNVVDCLVRLATHYNRTLVLSIHQPRSNVVKLFDKLIVLSHGEMIYSGDATRVNEYLRNNGYKCPSDYNIADYLIDLTMEPTRYTPATPALLSADLEATVAHNHDEVLHVPELGGSSTQREWEHFAIHRDELREMLHGPEGPGGRINSPSYNRLHSLFYDSPYAVELEANIEKANTSSEINGWSLPVQHDTANFLQQLSILNSRSFKNIYRDPKLLLTNYVATILLGLFLGTLYYNVENDIGGFQNRVGLFLFILTYLGFLTFTGLSMFSLERIIFIKERSNHYYSPAVYYISKIISDVIPLRVVPPILLCVIIYPLVGLNMENGAFFRCMGTLILFNVCISLEILTVGIIFKDLSTSLIISVMVILGSLLFSGLFINMKELSNIALRHLKNLSVFYYAYEALIINEVKTLTLREKKYGLNIEISGAAVLSTFGFVVQNMDFDINVLFICSIVFMLIGHTVLELFVIEKK